MTFKMIHSLALLALFAYFSGCEPAPGTDCHDLDIGKHVQDVGPGGGVPSPKPMTGTVGLGPDNIASITNMENVTMVLTYTPVGGAAVTDEIPSGVTSNAFAGLLGNGRISIAREQAFITERGDGADIRICVRTSSGSGNGGDKAPEPFIPNDLGKNAAGAKSVHLPEAWATMKDKWQEKSPNTAGWPAVLIVDDGFFYHVDTRVRPDLYPGFQRANSEGVATGGFQFGRHGTAVMSILGATQDNNIGIAGVAGPRKLANGDLVGGCEVIPALANGLIAGTGGMSPQNLAAAIEHYIDRPQLRVINISQSVIESTRGQSLAAAFQKAANKGILIVIGAGNDRTVRNERGVGDWLSAFNNVVVVGGLNRDGTDLWVENSQKGSATGTAVDIWAPAEDVEAIQTGNQIDLVSGTSFATPMVAGVAALMLNAKPSLLAPQIVQKLKQSAQEITLPGGMKVLRLDAQAAVEAAGRP